jgi:hypothetical protein
LASDDALDLWRINQVVYRPQIFYNVGENFHGYRYYSTNPSGQKFLLRFILNSTRYLQQMEESLGYAASSSTLAAGAEGNTAGSVDVPINLATFGYESEHSAPWAFTFQTIRPFYDRLMDELNVGRSQR